MSDSGSETPTDVAPGPACPLATTAAWRVLARSVAEAISLPPPARDGSGDQGGYHRLLADRCTVASAALRHVLGNSRAGADDICAAAQIVNEQCAAMRADYATAPAGHGGGWISGPSRS